MHRKTVLMFLFLAFGLVAAVGCNDAEGEVAATPASGVASEDAKTIAIATKYLGEKGPELGAGASSLVARPHVFRDLVGGRHVWFRQYLSGVRVAGAELVVHVARNGTVSGLTNALLRDVPKVEAPRFAPSDAIKRAIELFAASGTPRVQRTELVIDPRTRLLVYDIELFVTRVDTTVPTISATEVLLDARTLDRIRSWNALHSDALDVQGEGQFSGVVSVTVDRQPDGTLVLRDPTRGGMYVQNGASCAGTAWVPEQGPIYTSTHATLGDGEPFYSVRHAFVGAAPLAPYLDLARTPGHPDCAAVTRSPNGETATVDILHHAAVTYDMFKHVFGRLGTDGRDSALATIAHYDYANFPARPLNAFYSYDCDDDAPGDQQCAGFYTFFGPSGSPDPVYTAGLATLGFTDAVGIEALDVVAHEIGHGVTHYTNDLAYTEEPGGLNESYSDVFGALAELYGLSDRFAAHGTTFPDSAPGADFDFGEDTVPGRFQRSMTRPSSDASTFARRSRDAWSGSSIFRASDPHFTSGPANRAFRYLARGASGASVETFTPLLPDGLTGVGADLAARLWYDAIPYLTPLSNYVDMRRAVEQAAIGLGYDASSETMRQVGLAFDAINVGDAHRPSASRFVLADTEPNDGVGNGALATTRPDVLINATLDTIDFIDDGLVTGNVSKSDAVDLYAFYVEAGQDRVVTIDAPCTGKVDGSDPLVLRVRGADGHPAMASDGTQTADAIVVPCGARALSLRNFATGRDTTGGPTRSFRTAFIVAVSLAPNGDAEPRPYGLGVSDRPLSATPDGYSLTRGGTTLDVPFPLGVMRNDIAFPGTRATQTSATSRGTLTFGSDGSFSYALGAPNNSTFALLDAFRYVLEYNGAVSNEAEVVITIPGRFPFIPIYALPFKPYRYRGCPDPGPQPWREIATVVVQAKEQAIELVFPSAVPLRFRAEGASRGRLVVEGEHVLYVPPASGFDTDRVALGIDDASCGVTHHAVITFASR